MGRFWDALVAFAATELATRLTPNAVWEPLQAALASDLGSMPSLQHIPHHQGENRFQKQPQLRPSLRLASRIQAKSGQTATNRLKRQGNVNKDFQPLAQRW